MGSWRTFQLHSSGLFLKRWNGGFVRGSKSGDERVSLKGLADWGAQSYLGVPMLDRAPRLDDVAHRLHGHPQIPRTPSGTFRCPSNLTSQDFGLPVTGPASFGNSMKTRTQSRICLRSLLCFMHTCRFWHHQSPGQIQNNFFGNLGAGRGSRTPKVLSTGEF